MRAAGRAMPWARRSLIECCAAAGLADRAWHTALDDARGAADLLIHLLHQAPHLVEPDDDHHAAAAWTWPRFPPHHRHTGAPHPDSATSSRISSPGSSTASPAPATPPPTPTSPCSTARYSTGRSPPPKPTPSSTSPTTSASPRPKPSTPTTAICDALAEAVWADGVLTEDERRDVDTVATLLAVDPDAVEEILATTRTGPPRPADASSELQRHRTRPATGRHRRPHRPDASRASRDHRPSRSGRPPHDQFGQPPHQHRRR